MRHFFRQLIWHIYMIKPIRATYLYFARWSLDVARRWGLLYRHRASLGQHNERYSIGIVTYIRRYDQFFKPLIENLVKLFPDTEIVVAINGYYDQLQQEEYLKTIGELLACFPNIKPLPHKEAQSLAKLWNQLIIHATRQRVLILNDDLLVLPSFRKQFESCGILETDVGLLKRSWSHFVISKQVISRVGWFDERYPGVGNEDEDYEARLALAGASVPSFEIGGLRNIVVKTKDFSYGKDMAVVNRKYTSDNKQFFHSKWELADQPGDGFVHVRILGRCAKLREGMQTPNFYPAISYLNGAP